MSFIVGLVLFLGLFFPKSAFATDIVINEFSPASSPEWVELYNSSDQEISLKDVVIFFDASSTTNQKLTFCDNDKISAKSYKQINPVSSSSWLANTGDTLILKQGDDIVDTIIYGSGQTLKAPLATQSATRFPDGASSWVIAVPTPQGDMANFTCPEQVVEVSQPVAQAPTPKIDWNLEDKIFVGRDFKTTKLELSNFEINTEYFLKLRAGTEEGKLTKIQTKNGSAYLSDGESWDKFPLIKTDENAKWTGEIKGMLAEGKPDGKYKILLRIRKKDTESFYESEIKEINFSKVAEEIIVIATSTAATKSSIVATPAAQIKTKEPEVLGAATEIANPTPVKPQVIPKKDFSWLAVLGSGLIISAAIMGVFLHKNRLWDIIKSRL